MFTEPKKYLSQLKFFGTTYTYVYLLICRYSPLTMVFCAQLALFCPDGALFPDGVFCPGGVLSPGGVISLSSVFSPCGLLSTGGVPFPSMKYY